MEEDLLEIDKLTDRFFSVFDNKNKRIPPVEELTTICIAECIIIKNNSGDPVIYDLEGFIAPRAKILSDGTLTEFSEEEVSGETSVFGHVAQRSSLYKKSGILNGERFEGEGMKVFQFIKVGGQWKLSSLAWCDKE